MESIQPVIEHDTPICIVGGVSVGMLTALNLSRFGVKCLLAELARDHEAS
jgi:2-polyprenyl-6-methoxyphenol hydroxylase-like FAD-dependent oxidoreductase